MVSGVEQRYISEVAQRYDEIVISSKVFKGANLIGN